MKKLVDIDRIKGHLLLSILRDNGISAHLRDEYNNEMAPSVWIENDVEYDKAIQYVDAVLGCSQQHIEKSKRMIAWVCVLIGIVLIFVILAIEYKLIIV